MLLRPVEIDLAGRHGLEGSLHTERDDVDMGNNNRNEQNGDHGVYDLRDLHPRDIRHVEWEHQHIAGNNDGRSVAEGKTKQQFLSVDVTSPWRPPRVVAPPNLLIHT